MTTIVKHRLYVDDLIPGQNYYIVDNWNLDCEKRNKPLTFIAPYVRSYPLQRITSVVFIQNNYERCINSMYEFYLVMLTSQDFKKELKNVYLKKIPSLQNLAKKAIPIEVIKEIQGTLYHSEIYLQFNY